MHNGAMLDIAKTIMHSNSGSFCTTKSISNTSFLELFLKSVVGVNVIEDQYPDQRVLDTRYAAKITAELNSASSDTKKSIPNTTTFK